jgi:DNA replication protein
VGNDGKFEGFPPGKTRLIALPAVFFNDLLPMIDDLGELKLTLFAVWALQQKDSMSVDGSHYRYLRGADFINPTAMKVHGLDGAALIDAVRRAIIRGTLLYAGVKLGAKEETLYFVNTPQGRAAVRQIGAGKWRPGDMENPVEILPERPSVYLLYEENIGPLTPLIADELKDTEAEFGVDWLSEAISISVNAEKRSMRYVRAILERWKKEGKRDEVFTGHPEPDGKRYVSGEFGDFIKR